MTTEPDPIDADLPSEPQGLEASTAPSSEDPATRYQRLDDAIVASLREAGTEGIPLASLWQLHAGTALPFVLNVAQAQRLVDRRLQVLRNLEAIHCVDMVWHFGAAPQSTADRDLDPRDPADLARLCAEVLEWVKTGSLPEHSAFRAYAESSAFDGDPDARYQLAERRIELAALQYVADQRGRSNPGTLSAAAEN